MRVNIQDIPEDGLCLEQELSSTALDLNTEYFKCLSPLQVKALVEKADDEILVQAKVKGRYEMTCARCLEPIKQDRDDEFELYFDVTPGMESIDIGEDLRQELTILLSAVILCRPDCKGICPECGSYLNREKCGCRPGDKEELKHGIKIETKKK